MAPNHGEPAGVQGKESSRRLADCTVTKAEQPLDRADKINNLIAIARKENLENRKSTTS
jgi:hypothetical protein